MNYTDSNGLVNYIGKLSLRRMNHLEQCHALLDFEEDFEYKTYLSTICNNYTFCWKYRLNSCGVEYHLTVKRNYCRLL